MVSTTRRNSIEKTLTKRPRAGTFPTEGDASATGGGARAGTFPTVGDASATSADGPTQPRLETRSYFNLPTRVAPAYSLQHRRTYVCCFFKSMARSPWVWGVMELPLTPVGKEKATFPNGTS